jgi:mRNA interferase HigB
MRVVKPKTVREYARQYPDAAEWLMTWLKAARLAGWQNIQELRAMYPHADAVETENGNIVTVLNVRGNRYRLIIAVNYRWAMVYVLRFLTHVEYDKEKWKAEL